MAINSWHHRIFPTTPDACPCCGSHAPKTRLHVFYNCLHIQIFPFSILYRICHPLFLAKPGPTLPWAGAYLIFFFQAGLLNSKMYGCLFGNQLYGTYGFGVTPLSFAMNAWAQLKWSNSCRKLLSITLASYGISKWNVKLNGLWCFPEYTKNSRINGSVNGMTFLHLWWHCH